MATRKTRQGRGGGGGLKGGLMAGFMILAIIGFAFGWAKANNITGLGGVIDYFRTWSAQVQDCGISNLEWNCSTPIPGYDGNNNASSVSGEELPAAAETLALLDGIAIADPQDVDYVRSEWKHWSDFDGDKCDAREETLKLSGENVKTDPSNCKIISGTWVEPYALQTITDSSKIDIDHVVALSYAAANGGQELSKEMKEQFANDPLNLYISAPSENRSKGDKGVSEYLPPNEAFHCEYVTSFVTVIDKYDLSMAKAEKDKARQVLETKC